MPYTHRKIGNKQCVFKKEDGSKVGCTAGSIEKYLGALHANANESITEKKTPKIFSYTTYRLPTNDELKDINSCDLNAEEINKGFGYTIVGKGIEDDKNKKLIINAISMLCSMYPENEEYKKALANAKEMKGRFITETNQIKGGKADNMTIQDIADKFGLSVSKIKHQLEMGKKVEHEHTNNINKATEIAMDHLSEFPDYYTRLSKMEKEGEKHAKKLEVHESTKSLIKRLIRENIGLESQKGSMTTFNIKDKGDVVGTVVVCQANKTFGKDTMEIANISFSNNVINLEIGKKTLVAIFKQYPDIERLVIQPKPESRDFWFKLDAQRINDDYMIIFRAH